MRPASTACVVEALKLLREAYQSGKPYDLVLTDANMPDLDGFELASRVEQDRQLGSTVIMMLTSGDRPGDIARCEQLGVAAYLLKPIKQSELFDAIVTALGIAKAEDDGHAAASELAGLHPLRILLAEDRPRQPEAGGRRVGEARAQRSSWPATASRPWPRSTRRCSIWCSWTCRCRKWTASRRPPQSAPGSEPRPAPSDHRHDRPRHEGGSRAMPGVGHGRLRRQADPAPSNSSAPSTGCSHYRARTDRSPRGPRASLGETRPRDASPGEMRPRGAAYGDFARAAFPALAGFLTAMRTIVFNRSGAVMWGSLM